MVLFKEKKKILYSKRKLAICAALLCIFVFILSAQAVLAITIQACDIDGNPKNVFDQNEDIFIKGTGFLDQNDYAVYLVEDTTWSIGLNVPQRVPNSAEIVVVYPGDNGVLFPSRIWELEDTYVGSFDIFVENLFQGTALEYEDTEYEDLLDNQVGTAGISIVSEATPTPTVTPTPTTSPTLTPTPTSSPSPTPTSTPTGSPTPIPSPTPSPSPESGIPMTYVYAGIAIVAIIIVILVVYLLRRK